MDCSAPSRLDVTYEAASRADSKVFRNSFSEILKQIFGVLQNFIFDDAFIDVSLQLITGPSCDAQYLSFDDRKTSLTDSVEKENAFSLAADGFCSKANRIMCFICHLPDDLAGNTSSKKDHKADCVFKQLKTYIDGDRGECGSLQQDCTTSVLKHLKTEIGSTRFTVVHEMDFNPDIVCMILARQYLTEHKSFSSSGELVEALLDEESKPTWPFVMDGIFEFIHQTSVRPQTHPAVQLQRINDSPSNSLSLRDETMKLYIESLCKQCYQNMVDHLLLPCEHLALCSKCSLQVECCPICRSKIESTIRVFIN